MKSVLILGATGMLGHKLYKDMARDERFTVHATARSEQNLQSWFTGEELEQIITGVDTDRIETFYEVIDRVKPDVVINCIGIIKQLPEANNPVITISTNALFPHLIAEHCGKSGSRVIHISTDCVFDGRQGNYIEADAPNATDLYGRSKQMGELTTYEHAVTLRTSVIGHELKHHVSLIDWFLNQTGTVRGYTEAIYTGFPSIELSRIIKDYVIPNAALSGLYHVSSSPISKYELLRIVAARYGISTEIVPFDEYKDNKSLNSERFQQITGYTAPSWSELVNRMYDDFTNMQKEGTYRYENHDYCRDAT